MLSCSRRLKMMFFVGLIFLSGLFVEHTKVIKNRTLYSTASTNNSRWNQFCDVDVKNKILDSKVLVDQLEEINFEENQYRTCLSINANANATGVYKFMDETNFDGVICKTTAKRFTKTGEMPMTILISETVWGLQKLLDSFELYYRKWKRNVNTVKTKIMIFRKRGRGKATSKFLYFGIELEVDECINYLGFYTGAMHNDSRLRTVFKGEGHHENVIVVKTHRDVNQSVALRVDKAILLIRDPFESVRSLYNFVKTRSHLGIIDEKLLDKQDFATFAEQKVANYTAFYLQWLNEFKGRVLIVFYDDLVNDLLNSVTKIASFLGTKVTLRKLWCINKSNNGHFKRGSKPKWLSRSNLLNAELEKNFTVSKRLVWVESSRRVSNFTSVR